MQQPKKKTGIKENHQTVNPWWIEIEVKMIIRIGVKI